MTQHTLLFSLVAFVLAGAALAHETRIVGEGENQYRVIVGTVHEPIFTEERNGLDLIVRTMDDEPVEGLAGSLAVEITAPDGVSTRTLELRAQWGQPGRYTDDIVLTELGVYLIRVWGFIGDIELDETFETHEVRPLAELRFP